MKRQATLVFSSHRPETVEPARNLMARHDAVILEEPPAKKFLPMLSGQVDIDEYLEELDLDVEYPEFNRRTAHTLRELNQAGKRLYQIEPFLENLLAIHDLFADGGGPSDLKEGTDLYRVYVAEREATGALLDFYTVSVRGSFEQTLEAVKRFTAIDAQRFALRDRMRAEAIVEVLATPGNYYIEAGQIHYPLRRELKRRLPSGYALTVRFLMAEAVRKMGRPGHLYGPGDLLTLLYRFHPISNSLHEDRLAARALLYNKLIVKEELSETDQPYPHSRNEMEVGATVRNLSLEDCRRLFPMIRQASTESARQMVQEYLEKKKQPAK